MINFQPLGSRVVIKLAEVITETKSGIVLPEASKERPQEGTVLAVGPNVSPLVREGSVVLFGKYSGTEIKIDGETLVLLDDEDIFGIKKS